MANNICMNCFKIKGAYEVCPHCGYVEGTPPKQPNDLVPGTILESRYIIGTSIGFGGFGITYKAFDMVLGIIVAIKEFYPAGLVNRAVGDMKVGVFSGEKEDEFQIQLSRFLDEARNMAVFSKEQDIVNVYHYFQANGTAYTVMEYIDGVLLKTFLKENGKMEVEDALSFFIPILRSVEKIHEHQIIHKDISPDNIFLLDNERIKLFDFGAAHFPDGQQEKTFSVVIKSGYAPPEQYHSKYEQGPFMDVYALGAVFYEMITGRKPDEGSDRAVKDELEFPIKLGIALDKNLEKILRKAMAVDPRQRFQTVTEFRECIEQNRRVELPEEGATRKVRKRAVLVSAVAGILAVVVAGTAGYYWTVMQKRLQPSWVKEDTISVWLLSEKNKEADQEDVAALLEKDMKENCPKITLEITELTEEEYKEKLPKAEADGTLPDVFCTDYLTGELVASCAETGKIFQTLDMEEYPYFARFADVGTAVYEVPTGIQTLIAYENYGKYEKNGANTDSQITQKELKDMPKEQWTTDVGKLNEFAKQDKALRLFAGDLSQLDAVSEVTVRAVPSQEFTAVPIVDENGNLEAAFTQCYGVKKDSSKNKQEAGMVSICLLLGKNIQEESYLRNYEGLPVQKEALTQYQDLKLNGYLEFLNDYLNKLQIADEYNIL